MTEEYLRYWGLDHHPFLLAPDGSMMCVTGQYFECFERLKYAISTNKGGVVVASEDAGLGKTTILLKLIDEMKAEYGSHFRYAFVDHPTLTSDQMIGQITGLITGEMPAEDKLRNLTTLKDSLIAARQEGGKSIIVIDEGQMLCEARNVLQELRVLINLTHNNEYLHTFILSGQKALWDTLQEMPEFWQRLPVRYYFTPLRFEETRELIRYRLNKAGLDVAREIFAQDALEIIHKYSKGLPRTIIAVSDLALLNGYNDKTRKIGFKEVSKAINSMSGRGESLPYIVADRGEAPKETVRAPSDTAAAMRNPAPPLEYVSHSASTTFFDSSSRQYLKPVLVTLLILLFIFIGAAGYRFVLATKQPQNTIVIKEVQKPEVPKEPAVESAQPKDQQETGETRPQTQAEAPPEKDVIAAFKDEMKKKNESTQNRVAIVRAPAANIRSGPGIESQRILTIVQGEILPILDERSDNTGMKWYKVGLYGNRTGWIASQVATATTK
ncbi:MAG: Serine/threonine-protein kinase D [Syntrophorhabdus sp. PtaB.Bin047]|jgi:type II secretory pathway predicted ATPase ExeA|nr:MAG: Serine/threonine-protein kinase D [Syntrophorhabdus sp. PtaB.Bin047]